jgi:hypothetical protein
LSWMYYEVYSMALIVFSFLFLWWLCSYTDRQTKRIREREYEIAVRNYANRTCPVEHRTEGTATPAIR